MLYQQTQLTMKKALFTFFAAFIVFAAAAQMNQGTMIIGGSVGFESNKEKVESGGVSVDQGTITSLEFAPQFGYFVIDNLAVGATLNFSNSKFKPDGGGGDQTSSSFVFNPFARYYFGNIFGEGQVGFGSMKFDDGDGESKDKIFGWQIGAGYAAFLNESVAIEPQIGYRSVSFDDNDFDFKSTSSGLIFRVAIQVYLGRE